MKLLLFKRPTSFLTLCSPVEVDSLSEARTKLLWKNSTYYCSRKTLNGRIIQRKDGSLKFCNVDACFPSFGRSVSGHFSLRLSPLELPYARLFLGIFWYTDNTVSSNFSDLSEGDRNELKKMKIYIVFLLAYKNIQCFSVGYF